MKKTAMIVAAVGFVCGGGWVRADPEADRRLQTAISSSYNFQTVLEDRVQVEVREGVVTLTGTVLDGDQRALAADTARGQPGVVELHNHLDVVTPGRERSDGWIELKLRGLLLVRAGVSATRTEITVRAGLVTLGGQAETMAQKELTERCARGVEGVRGVRNEMRVRADPGDRGRPMAGNE